MRVSIDASGLGGAKTGTAVYLAEILNVWNQDRKIDHEFVIFTTELARRHFEGLALDWRFRFVFAPSRRVVRVVWQQTVMPLLISRLGVDVHWGPGFALPLVSRKPMVLTVHDLTFHLFPEVHEWIKRRYFPAMIKASVKKADAVMAVSESTRSDLHRLIPESRSKTTVTLLAARSLVRHVTEYVAEHQPEAGEDYFLFVGTIEPRKNLSRLIDAWQSMDSDVRGRTRLVVVGASGWLVGDLMSRLKSDQTVLFLGAVDDATLALLMRRARAFLYPSLYEGFGLPVLEAMSMGVPVLTANVGATREVADGAAILIDPNSEAQIRAGLECLLTDADLCQSLRVLGQERSAAFSWARTAHKTLSVIERAVIQ